MEYVYGVEEKELHIRTCLHIDINQSDWCGYDFPAKVLVIKLRQRTRSWEITATLMVKGFMEEDWEGRVRSK